LQKPQADLASNSQATLSLLEECRKRNPRARIVFTSTRQVYGIPQYLPVDEAHPVVPLDINGIHKAAAEQYCQLYARIYGMDVTVLRLVNTYGPRMGLTGASLPLVANWVRRLRLGHPLELWNGELMRDFSYIDDVVSALMIAGGMDEGGCQIYNLGGTRIHLRELAELLISIHGRGIIRSKKYPGERKMIEIGTIYSDDSKFKKKTGWNPQVPLPEGLRRTLEYYQQYQTQYLP